MKITTNKVEGSKTVLLLQPTSQELEKLKNHVLGHFKDSVKVPGFREGSAPLALIEKSVNQQQLTDEFLSHAVNEFYAKAIEVEKLRPVGQPKVTIKKFVPYTQLEFEAEFESLGNITLPDYKKIKVAKKTVIVTAKDINDTLEQLRQRLSERKPVERPAKEGDEVLIDFDGYDKGGKAVAGASGKRYPLLLGSKNFIPGFEKALIGLKAGDDKDLKVTFPADYHVKALAGQPVDFKVKVHFVNEMVEPKIDDQLATKAGPFKNLAELKADIKKQLQAEREAQAARDLENYIVQKITQKSKLTVPRSLVDEELERLELEEKQNIAYRGQTWQEHLDEEKVSEEQHRERQRPMATERVKGGLVLSEIAEREKIQATDEEVKERIELLKGQYQDEQMKAELDKPENRNNIVSRILTEKTIAKLVNYATQK